MKISFILQVNLVFNIFICTIYLTNLKRSNLLFDLLLVVNPYSNNILYFTLRMNLDKKAVFKMCIYFTKMF